MKLLSGNSNRLLAEAIATHLQTPLVDARIQRFADQEVFIEIHDNVRGADVFVIQPTSAPANDSIMELLIMIDALRRGSARRVTAVIPYYGYGRQDRKTGPRTPISAKLVANLITVAGADRVLTVDLHAGQIQGFFDIPVDNLYAAPLFARHLAQQLAGQPLTIVSPDIGGMVRARELAGRLGAELAVIDKRRSAPGQSEALQVIGAVAGRVCVLHDDLVDSGGTICNAASLLMTEGAQAVQACVTHGVFSGKAAQRIAAAPFSAVYVTDSIMLSDTVRAVASIHPISIAPLLGDAIQRISSEQSVSDLFT